MHPTPTPLAAEVSSRTRSYTRLHEGPLGAPSRNELRIDEADDLAEVEKSARTWVAGGFTVWIYDHGNTAVAPGGSDYRTILKYSPDGQLVDYR
jgi:hypothetical protein